MAGCVSVAVGVVIESPLSEGPEERGCVQRHPTARVTSSFSRNVFRQSFFDQSRRERGVPPVRPGRRGLLRAGRGGGRPLPRRRGTVLCGGTTPRGGRRAPRTRAGQEGRAGQEDTAGRRQRRRPVHLPSALGPPDPLRPTRPTPSTLGPPDPRQATPARRTHSGPGPYAEPLRPIRPPPTCLPEPPPPAPPHSPPAHRTRRPHPTRPPSHPPRPRPRPDPLALGPAVPPGPVEEVSRPAGRAPARRCRRPGGRRR